jgi:hypothetical protein
VGTLCSSTSSRGACFTVSTTVLDAQRTGDRLAASLVGARPGHYCAVRFEARSPIYSDVAVDFPEVTVTDLSCDSSGCQEVCKYGSPDAGIAWAGTLYKFDSEEWEGELTARMVTPSMAVDPFCTTSNLRVWFRVASPP